MKTSMLLVGDQQSALCNLAEMQKQERAHRTGKLRVAVAVLTRNRPAMLARCLASFGKLRAPENCTVTYVIVENGKAGQARAVVEGFMERFAEPRVIFRQVSEPSIPAARNEALRAAEFHEADLIAFIDDDERAEPDWLASMIDRFRDSDLALVGGPVLPHFEAQSDSFWMRRAEDGLRSYYQKRNRRAQRLLVRGRQDQIVIITNNWLGDIRIFSELGLKFDEGLAESGGSDMRLYRDCLAAGVRSGWAPEAKVTETVSADRLSIVYQFRRSLHQSRVTFRVKAADQGLGREILRNVPAVISRVLLLPLHVPVLLASRGGTLVYSAQSLGWICGRVSAMFGARSDLYRKTTGY